LLQEIPDSIWEHFLHKSKQKNRPRSPQISLSDSHHMPVALAVNVHIRAHGLLRLHAPTDFKGGGGSENGAATAVMRG
jgi:hypothetical protein